MKALLISIAVATAALTMAPAASASNFNDLRTQMSAARESLVTMLTNKDKRGADQQKVVKDTADRVSATIATLKPPAGKEAKFKELVDTWSAFKKTREQELVPLILAGKDAEARKLATGIQKDRITRCQELLSELGG
jgi:Ni/Co efflux regulator RcnB